MVQCSLFELVARFFRDRGFARGSSITQLESEYLRHQLARCLWNYGFGHDPAVSVNDFTSYLAGIPQIPYGLLRFDADLRYLSLADPRPGLSGVCKLLGVKFDESFCTDDSAEPFDDRFALPTTPFWFRHDDGRRNRNRRPDHCRDERVGTIQAGSATEGLFAFVHHPKIVVEGEHVLDLPATVLRGERIDCACLGVWIGGQVELDFVRKTERANPRFGTLRVRRS